MLTAKNNFYNNNLNFNINLLYLPAICNMTNKG